MAEARKQDTGVDMFPGYERPTRSNVTDPTTKTVTPGAGNAGPGTTVTLL